MMATILRFCLSGLLILLGASLQFVSYYGGYATDARPKWAPVLKVAGFGAHFAGMAILPFPLPVVISLIVANIVVIAFGVPISGLIDKFLRSLKK